MTARGDRQLLPAHRGQPRHARPRGPRRSPRSPRTSTCTPSCAASSSGAAQALESGGPIDWAFAEALAFGTLVLEGTPVRLSGQDSEPRHVQPAPPGLLRFGNRRAATSRCSTSRPDQARFDVYDSSLSEYAVLGFEFGYSVADPLTLVHLGSAVRRLRQRRADHDRPVHLLLPSRSGASRAGWSAAAARLRRAGAGAFERAHRALPAALRRGQHAGVQLHHARAVLPPAAPPDVRRHGPPRHAQAADRLHAQEPAAPPAAPSRTLEEFTGGGFREVLATTADVEPGRVTRVVFCSGKVYYDLLAAREAQGAGHVALVRVEQLYPFADGAGEGRAGALSGHGRGRLGAGGAAQHGPMALHAASASSRSLEATRPRRSATWAGRKAPARPPAPGSATSRSRRKLSPPRSSPAPPRACGWWRAGRRPSSSDSPRWPRNRKSTPARPCRRGARSPGCARRWAAG